MMKMKGKLTAVGLKQFIGKMKLPQKTQKDNHSLIHDVRSSTKQ